VRLDGEESRHRALLVAFANGREYGMGAVLAPDAELDDGLLNAYVIEDRSVPARFWHARHLARGSVARAPGVLIRKVRRAVIETDAPYGAPQAYRGKRNEPAYVVEAAGQIAAELGLPVGAVAAATSANAGRLFGLPVLVA